MKELLTKLGLEPKYKEVRAFQVELESSANCDGEAASVFQNKCWQIVAKLIDMHTTVELEEEKAKHKRDNVYNDLKSECEEKADAAKDRWAKTQQTYRDAAMEFSKAKTLNNHLADLMKFFESGIYVMRSRQEKEARSWQATPTQETQ